MLTQPSEVPLLFFLSHKHTANGVGQHETRTSVIGVGQAQRPKGLRQRGLADRDQQLRDHGRPGRRHRVADAAQQDHHVPFDQRSAADQGGTGRRPKRRASWEPSAGRSCEPSRNNATWAIRTMTIESRGSMCAAPGEATEPIRPPAALITGRSRMRSSKILVGAALLAALAGWAARRPAEKARSSDRENHIARAGLGGQHAIAAGALECQRRPLSDLDDGAGRRGPAGRRLDDHARQIRQEHSPGGRLSAQAQPAQRPDRRPAARRPLHLRPRLFDALPVAGAGRGRGRDAGARN